MPRLVVEGHQNRKSAPYCDPIQKNPKRCKNPTATVSGASNGVISLVARIERKRNPGSSRVSLPLNAGYRGRSKLAQQATVTAASIMDAGKPKHIPNARLRCCHHRHVELALPALNHCKGRNDKRHAGRNDLVEFVRKHLGQEWRTGVADARSGAVDSGSIWIIAMEGQCRASSRCSPSSPEREGLS